MRTIKSIFSEDQSDRKNPDFIGEDKYLYYKKRGELEKYHLNKLEKKLKVQLPKPIIKPKTLWQKIKTIFQKK